MAVRLARAFACGSARVSSLWLTVVLASEPLCRCRFSVQAGIAANAGGGPAI
jgi:hypothetical protein